MTARPTIHGKKSSYDAGCRCQDCWQANRIAAKTYKLRRHRMGGSTTVDAAPTAAILNELLARMSATALASALDTTHTWVRSVAQGKTRRINPTKAKKVADLYASDYLPPASNDDGRTTHMTPLGARRRVQALIAMGWTLHHIRDDAGVTLTLLKDLLAERWPVIEARTHHKIADSYARLSMRLPEGDTPHQRGAITRARKRGSDNGWPPPLAWDDIDDPNEQPKGIARNKKSTAGRPEVMTARIENFDWLLSMGETPQSAAARLGVRLESFTAQRAKHERKNGGAA